ncbi:uncharacterized protein LOC143914076 [Arctopsyche grandis]|uniref:uncharacterized protein LOC143914076 n=1 Tax=Arctopsyche grandis TaxID=121162 RepID=UPI00406D8C94
MSMILYFSVGFAIFTLMVICMYFCNGCKVVSPHNRRKRVVHQQSSIFVVTGRVHTPTSISGNRNSDGLSSNSTGAVVHAPPPAYTTIDLTESSTSRFETCPPPPSYDEAVRI